MPRYASKHFIAKGHSMAAFGAVPRVDPALPNPFGMYLLEGWARGRHGQPAGCWEEHDNGSRRVFCPNDRPKLKKIRCGQ
jgi:hypothetical protein